MSAGPNAGQLSELDIQLFSQLARDPEARKALLPHAKRVMPNLSLPEYDAQVSAQAAVEAATRPLLERLEAMEAERKKEKDQEFWEGQRNILRRRGYTEPQVTEFEKRVADEFKGGQLNYGEIDDYFRTKDFPLSPRNSSVGMSGRPKSSAEQTWRKDLRTPKSNPATKSFEGDQTDYYKGLWNKAAEELATRQ